MTNERNVNERYVNGALRHLDKLDRFVPLTRSLPIAGILLTAAFAGVGNVEDEVFCGTEHFWNVVLWIFAILMSSIPVIDFYRRIVNLNGRMVTRWQQYVSPLVLVALGGHEGSRRRLDAKSARSWSEGRQRESETQGALAVHHAANLAMGAGFGIDVVSLSAAAVSWLVRTDRREQAAIWMGATTPRAITSLLRLESQDAATLVRRARRSRKIEGRLGLTRQAIAALNVQATKS